MKLRKQYHFWPSERGLQAWDVHRLIELTRDLPVVRLPLSSIDEVDTVYWFDDDFEKPTVRKVIEHAKLMQEADLAWPIILSSTGRVMDGMHRIAKALMGGHETIDAVRFEVDPEPDYVGVAPRDLPYD